MENQHRKINGYRELTQDEIDLMNEIKAKGLELGNLVIKLQYHVETQAVAAALMTGPVGEEERLRLARANPQHWLLTGTTHLQEGLMGITRAVAQPTSF